MFKQKKITTAIATIAVIMFLASPVMAKQRYQPFRKGAPRAGQLDNSREQLDVHCNGILGVTTCGIRGVISGTAKTLSAVPNPFSGSADQRDFKFAINSPGASPRR